MNTFNDQPFYRIKNDVNGNPRYVLHFLAFARSYADAYPIARAAGFTAYRGRDFGGCFVTQSYSLKETSSVIQRCIDEVEWCRGIRAAAMKGELE